MEIWKTINQAPQYEVSSFGRVRHIKYRKIRKFRLVNGYQRITFVYKGKCVSKKIHRLVGEVFLGTKPEHQVDHINRNRVDNRLENLRNVTGFDNNLNKTAKYISIVESIISMHKDNKSTTEIIEMVF